MRYIYSLPPLVRIPWGILALLLVTLAACGQGSSTSSTSAGPTAAPTATLQGMVVSSGGLSKGSAAPAVSPVAGATVQIYDLERTSSAPVSTTTTDAAGRWTATVPLKPEGTGKFAVFAVVPDGGGGQRVARQEDVAVTQAAATVIVPEMAAERDSTPPTILAILDDASGVLTAHDPDPLFEPNPIATGSKLSLVLSEPVPPDALQQGAIELYAADADWKEGNLYASSAFSHNTVTFQGNLKTFFYSPDPPLAPNRHYLLKVKTAGGRHLLTDHAQNVISDNGDRDQVAALARISTFPATTVQPLPTPLASSIGDTTVPATTPVQTFTLEVTVAGSGTVSGPGLTCASGVCRAAYPSGTVVTLTVTPASGWVFNGWGGACTGTGTCGLTMTAERSVTVAFGITPPSAPTGLTATPGNGQVTLTWAAVPGATGYTVYMALTSWTTWSSILPGAMIHADLTSTTFTHTGLTNGTTYWFAVSASNSGGESAQLPQVSAGLRVTVTRVAAADYHACALLSNGTVKCWGTNESGQLGAGTNTGPETCEYFPCSTTPVQVSGITTATAITVGGSNTCALLLDSTVKCWGDNYYGQLGTGTNTGPDDCYGYFCSATPVLVSGISTAVAIASGGNHACALLSGGMIQCWGRNNVGQLGNETVPVNLYSYSPIPVTVSGISNATAVAASAHTCALLADGTIQCWGLNNYGELGDGTTTSRNAPVAVSGISTAAVLVTGDGHTCVVLLDSTVKCWGWNSAGQLGDGTMTSRNAPVAVSGISTATTIAGGALHTCAVLTNSTLRCWGHNGTGQLGTGTITSPSTNPVEVSGISTATAVAAGPYHTCALLADGGVKCWGDNYYGTLGDGTTTDRLIPVTVLGF